MNIRRGDNKRESWWIRNLTKKTITIGDLLLLPAIKPNKRVDALYYYSREKVGHSKVLVKLVKAGIVSFDKDKIYVNEFPGPISSDKIDEAITSAEENEIPYPDMTADMILTTTVGDPGSDSYVVTEQGIREALTAILHNDLQGLQGGDADEYYHLTEYQEVLVSRFGEDSSGLTFDGLPIGADSLWSKSGTTLSPLFEGDNILTTGDITATNISGTILTPNQPNIIHNLLRDLQGGDPSNDEFYHLSIEEVDKIATIIEAVTPGQEITDDTDGAILYGKDPDDTAQAVGISGEENNEVLTMDLDLKTILEDIYLELIKANIQMSIITGNHIKNTDIDPMQEN